MAVAPLPALAAAGVWIVLFFAFRYASVSSIVAAVSLPLWALLFGSSWPVIAFTSGADVYVKNLVTKPKLDILLNGKDLITIDVESGCTWH